MNSASCRRCRLRAPSVPESIIAVPGSSAARRAARTVPEPELCPNDVRTTCAACGEPRRGGAGCGCAVPGGTGNNTGRSQGCRSPPTRSIKPSSPRDCALHRRHALRPTGTPGTATPPPWVPRCGPVLHVRSGTNKATPTRGMITACSGAGRDRAPGTPTSGCQARPIGTWASTTTRGRHATRGGGMNHGSRRL
jgi:hypothetical protein